MTAQRFHIRKIVATAPRDQVVSEVLARQCPEGWWIIPCATLGLSAYSVLALMLWHWT